MIALEFYFLKGHYSLQWDKKTLYKTFMFFLNAKEYKVVYLSQRGKLSLQLSIHKFPGYVILDVLFRGRKEKEGM
jgi:hypothetical protein